MAGLFDFNNSGGFDLGDISSGISKGINAIGGLFGNSGASDVLGATAKDFNAPMDYDFFDGDADSLASSMDTVSEGGGLFGQGMDFLNKNKDTMNVLATLGKGIGDYQTASTTQDYLKSLMAEQQRQVAKEKQATASQQSGFSSSALASNYYNV